MEECRDQDVYIRGLLAKRLKCRRFESGLTIGHSSPAVDRESREMSDRKRGGWRQMEFDKRMKEGQEAGSRGLEVARILRGWQVRL